VKKYSLLIILLILTTYVGAQVTIGSGIPPLEGVVLDLKEQEADSENITSRKGFLLPRVKLVAKDNLEPLLKNALEADKKDYTGVIVYNLLEIEGNNTGRSMKEGLYMWNGKEWTMIGNTPNFFYMPSFNLPLGPVGSTQSVNLYQEYIRQFKYDNVNNPNFTNGHGLTKVTGIYAQSDLYYIVLDFTPGIISNLQMNAQGNLSYKVESNTVPADAYINIICVVKE